MTVEDQTIITAYKCPECEHLHEEEPEVDPVYECQCGHTWQRSEMGSHRCEQCNKFAGKATETSCPECLVGVDEFEAIEAVVLDDGEVRPLDEWQEEQEEVAELEADGVDPREPISYQAYLRAHADHWIITNSGKHGDGKDQATLVATHLAMLEANNVSDRQVQVRRGVVWEERNPYHPIGKLVKSGRRIVPPAEGRAIALDRINEAIVEHQREHDYLTGVLAKISAGAPDDDLPYTYRRRVSDSERADWVATRRDMITRYEAKLAEFKAQRDDLLSLQGVGQ